jgi:diguanylate cyclase (GGDEF)-like protein/PAS domain S-box-containing protein
MFLDGKSFISRAPRHLWPLPTIVISIALGFCFILPERFGWILAAFVLALFVAQIFVSIVVWKNWNATHEQLAGVRHELSSLQGIVNVSRDAIIGVTTEGVIMSWNRGARGIYGYTSKEALGAPISMLFDHRSGHEANVLFDKVARGENVTQHEMVHRKKGSTPIDVSLTISPIVDGKTITGASVVARDITERKRAAGSLAQQAAAMKASMDGMAIIDHGGGCVYLNDAYAKIFGYTNPERLIGASWEMFYFEEELTRLKEEIMPAVWRDGSWRGEAIGLKLNGGTLPLEISISSVEGGGLVQVVRDITERKKLEETLRNSSLKDDLTGLFNRRGLLKQAAPYFDFARRQKESLLLLFIDLDGMKRINDEFGHNEGDNALMNTAAILNRSFRSSDIIARLGGDEFTVLVTDPNANKEDAIDRLNENLKAYNDSEKCGHKLAFSIGVATLEPERMTCFEELLEEADQAMYEQKRMKRQRADERTHKQIHPKKAKEKLTHDTVTGLPNRARFYDLLARRQVNKNRQWAVLLLDVDCFKLVSESLGNASADQLLIQIAQRVKTCLRQDDVLARVGDDEFAVLLDDVSGEGEASSVAARIQQALAISFNLLGQEVYTTMSIRIGLAPDCNMAPQLDLVEVAAGILNDQGVGVGAHRFVVE